MSRYAESYKFAALAGPGDARPTALQIIQDEDLINKLTDKTFVVTGVSSGIGIETLRALHATGAHVIGTIRNASKGQKVVDEILASNPNGGKITLVDMELASFASIRKGAQEILSKSSGKINGVINNAGIMAVPYGKTTDGYELQFATNHLGHFLLFQLLKPALLAAATPEFPSRVVSVSSIGHKLGPVRWDDLNFETGKYDPFAAYGQSKLANIWFANELERKYGAQNLHATSCHPGGIDSNLASSVDWANVDMSLMGGLLADDFKRYYKSAAQGAATQVYALLSEEWKGKGGRYLSDCVEQELYGTGERKEDPRFDDGYIEAAYDEQSEERLWKKSLEIVGVKEE